VAAPCRDFTAKGSLEILERERQFSQSNCIIQLIVQEFRVSDNFLFTKENISTFWDIGKGESYDQTFIKHAAVMLFGSRQVLKVGCVKGVTVNGVKRQGLDKIALEGIRGK